MSQQHDLMIDTEFLDPAPTGALVAVGAIFFDLATETTGATFSQTIHLATSMRDGGTVSPSTLLFWLMQPEDSRRRVFFAGSADIRDVLRDFAIWIGTNCRHEDVRPWGNSASTDLSMLETAYKRAHIPLPWRWNNERDFRTVRKMNPQVEYNPDEKGDGAHDPLVDCRFQIEHLFKIKRARRGQA